MKKITFLFLGFLSITATLRAQQDYYANQDTVSGTNVTYRVDRRYTGSYEINNITNTRTNQPMRLLNGAFAPPPFEQYKVHRIGDHAPIAKAILQEVLTPTELSAMINQTDSFDTGYVIDHNGNIVEVCFAFAANPPFSSISPDKWYSIEQKIKQRMKYTVSDKGKTVQYVIVSNVWGVRYMLK